jgi:hypothetical protein
MKQAFAAPIARLSMAGAACLFAPDRVGLRVCPTRFRRRFCRYRRFASVIRRFR